MASDAWRSNRRALARRLRRRRRLASLALLIVASAAAALIGFSPRHLNQTSTRAAPRPARQRRRGTIRRSHSVGLTRSHDSGLRTGGLGVPILMYHVINAPPPAAPYPGLYVQRAAFAAQMNALDAAGYHGVTLDQVVRDWTDGLALPRAHPIVISFDNGYRSQYLNALPVLRRLGWPGVENLQLSGLPPSQGGLDSREVRALVRAGWEVDTQGFSHADLPTLSPAQLRHEVFDARMVIRRRYHVPVHWFCYPSGHYDPTVAAAVESAGYSGATTVVPGWATSSSDLYRLPRLRVLAGTTPSSLLALIAGTRHSPPPPQSYGALHAAA
jgi:peptidoglycan/xylan/chitin deacetylase (PgdA/CDA1 family)